MSTVLLLSKEQQLWRVPGVPWPDPRRCHDCCCSVAIKGGDQPRHGAIIIPRVLQNQSLWGSAGGRARGCSEDGTTHARTSTLPPWLQKPLPSQRKNGAPAGESGIGGLTPGWQPGRPGAPAATALAGFWKPDPGQRVSRQAPNATAAPRHTGQLSRPRAAGSSGIRLWPQPTRPVFSLPGRVSAKPDHGRPPAQPRLRWGLSSWGWLFQQPQ